MPGNDVTVVQLCGRCNAQLGSFDIKKDNLMLTTKSTIWCPQCGQDTQEVRDLAGRLDAIKQETASYPKAVPAVPFPAQLTQER
jgi:DNA-directed RNA polymerase subunit RPC12/RpoP